MSTGRVTTEQLREALTRQKETGRRLGESLIELGHVGEEVVAQTLSEQLSVPWVSLSRVEFTRELLNLVSAEVASKWMVVPVYVRRARAKGGGGPGEQTLFVATDDPLNDRALLEVATHVGMSVKPMVAASGELRSVIRIYYGVELPSLVRDVLKPNPSMPPLEIDIEYDDGRPSEPEPEPAPAPKKKTSRPRSSAPEGRASSPEVPKAAPVPREVGPELPPIELGRPRAAKKKKVRMMTLTLLDGTTVTLPTGPKGSSAPPAERLTTRDLIQALDARAQGNDVKTVLGGASWESLFATLLSLLLRKGLVADWEFVEEWDKHPHPPA